MAKRKYFEEHIKYLEEIAPGKSSYEITEMFNKKFDMNVTRQAIRTLLTKHKIQTGAQKGNPKGYSKVFPKHIKEFINNNYTGHGPKDMVELLNKTFDTNYTHNQLKGYYGRYRLNSGLTGHYSKGSIPWNKGKKGFMGPNKTSLKKGSMPPNRVPIGTERLTKDGYIEVKIQDGHRNKNWRGKHILIWEKHNGPLPEDHAIIFGDGDKHNFDINNLICVSRAQLLKLNQYDLIKNDADITRTGVLIADVIAKTGKRKKEDLN